MPQIFVRDLAIWSKPRYLKAEALQVPQKVHAVLVYYLLSGIHILVYSCTGCGTSKIYLHLENNRLSFSRFSLKSETKGLLWTRFSLLVAKDMVFEKQKLDVKQLKMNKFMSDVKQLEMNRFIKSIWQFIISTSNATLQVPSLHP